MYPFFHKWTRAAVSSFVDNFEVMLYFSNLRSDCVFTNHRTNQPEVLQENEAYCTVSLRGKLSIVGISWIPY